MELDSRKCRIDFDDIDKIAIQLLKEVPDGQRKYKAKRDKMFNILYSWRDCDSLASIPRLAQVLIDCQLTDVALKLDPTCTCKLESGLNNQQVELD